MSKKLTIGLICGGTSGEHEVSLISAYNIQAALDRDKYDVLLIGIDKSGAWFLGKTPEFLTMSMMFVKLSSEKIYRSSFLKPETPLAKTWHQQNSPETS